MSMFDSLKKTIADLPISDIHKARLELALDRSAELETKLESLQSEHADLKAELKVVALDRDYQKREYDRLVQEHSEEIRIHKMIEFRRGKRTGDKWMAFCPQCHMPVKDVAGNNGIVAVCSSRCGWSGSVIGTSLEAVASQIA